MNLQTEEYFGLDDVGTTMWHVLNTSDSIQDAIETLQAAYDVEPDQVEVDVTDLISELLDHGLVEIA